jgi:hypothetical protein
MKVFISWSGDLSEEVAGILRKYLPCMIQGLDVFTSQHDIESGSRWSLQLAKEFDECNFGILCLTPKNLNSSWLLFEAGSLSKHIDGRACCLLLGDLSPADVVGPLSQFQNRRLNLEEFKKLIQDVNDKTERPLTESQLSLIFDKWWKDIEREYSEVISKSKKSAWISIKRDQQDLLEEILTKVRGIEKTLEPISPRQALPMTLTTFLDNIYYSRLNSNQRRILREIYQAIRKGERLDAKMLSEHYTKNDLELLFEFGLLTEADGRLVLTHKIIEDYLSDKRDITTGEI